MIRKVMEEFFLEFVGIIDLFSSGLALVAPWIVVQSSSTYQTFNLIESQYVFAAVLSNQDVYERYWAAVVAFSAATFLVSIGVYVACAQKAFLAGFILSLVEFVLSVIAWAVFFPSVEMYMKDTTSYTINSISMGSMLLVLSTVCSIVLTIWHGIRTFNICKF